jgi:hypothetical protein
LVSIVIVYIFVETNQISMKTLLSLNTNFYPYNGNFIPQAGDNIFLDYSIEDNKFFVVKFRTIDLANNQIIISIEKI